MIRVADVIMQQLQQCGIKHVFTVTGRGALFLTDALAANRELSTVCVHHEQAAAFAAVSYAEYTGNMGACLVSTGCAGTNTFTGILNAWQDGIPCIIISGQNKLKETSRYSGIPIRTFGQQEADLIPMVERMTKYATMVSDPKRIAFEMEKALYLARQGRMGPVWIDVPLDVQNMRVDPEKLEHFVPGVEVEMEPQNEDIQYTVAALSKAQRPVVLIGSAIRSSGATEELETLIERLGLPLVYAGSAPDTYGLENALSIGSVGTMGCSRAGNFTVQNSDLLLVFGNRLSPMTTGTDYEKFAREAKVVVVDIDEVEHSKPGIKIDRLVLADVKRCLTVLLNQEIRPVSNEWQSKCQHWKKIFPKFEDQYKKTEKIDLYYLAEALSEKLPENSVLLTDSGLIELILPTNINFKKGQRSIHPVSQGSMGFALPAVVGAYYASHKPVVAVIGDGSIMMNLQELETIRFNKIPAKIIVINNNAYAVIRKRQKELFGSRTIGTDPSDGISCPEFKKVAAGFDLPYARIESSDRLFEELETVLNAEGPVLCEIIGLEDQEYISNSYARNAKRRIVRRPIEDQAPYLDRELFLSEMIIQPIDQ